MSKIVLRNLCAMAGLFLGILGMIWYGVYYFQNPDMTELRLFLSNPYPSIMTLAGVGIVALSGLIK